MNYGIGNGGGFGVSVPLGGYNNTQAYSPYQTQGWTTLQGGSNWGQPTLGYSQPVYTQQSSGWANQRWGYNQPVNQGWTTMQPSSWSGQSYYPPSQTYYPPPQQYGYSPMSFVPGCGNCGHTKPVIRRDW